MQFRSLGDGSRVEEDSSAVQLLDGDVLIAGGNLSGTGTGTAAIVFHP
jgi:hypothetical protein